MEQVEQNRELPEEVWKEILSKLWLNEEDLEHLLTCRKVCPSWEKYVGELPPKLLWNPWLEHGTFSSNVAHYPMATTINCESDIMNFLPGGFEPGKNPFRNHTLGVLSNYYFQDEDKILLKIMESHGEHVWNFFYQPSGFISGNLGNFPQILAHMKNVRTLKLDCNNLPRKQLKTVDGNNFPTNLNKLSELLLKDYYSSLSDINDDDKMYAKLSVNYGSQIKSITVDTLTVPENRRNLLDRFPNLEDLKVEEFFLTSCSEPPSGKQWPKLKRLSLANRISEWDSSVLKSMLRFIGYFAETLQLLSLKINLRNKEAVGEGNPEGNEEVFATLSQLTQFIIPFWMMRDEGQTTNVAIETRFRFSLPSLKLLVLEDTKDEFKNRDIVGAELEEICAPFWPLVPPSVETISVRSENTNQVLEKDFPAVYKCNRNQLV